MLYPALPSLHKVKNRIHRSILKSLGLNSYMNLSKRNIGSGKKLACALANHTAHVLDVEQTSKQRVYSGGYGKDLVRNQSSYT